MNISEILVSKKTASYIRQLYPKNDADRKIRILKKERSVMLVALITVSVFVSLPVFAMQKSMLSNPVKEIMRNEYGKGTRSQTLRVVSDDGFRDKVTIEVGERKYTKEEIGEFSDRLDGELWTAILGDNKDAETVTTQLDLKTKLKGYPFDISWRTDRPLILSSTGAINREWLAEEDPENKGVYVQLRATLTYGDHSEDRYSYVIVRRAEEGSEASVKEALSDSIRENDEKSSTDARQKLPDTVLGKKTEFYDASVNKGWAVLFTGIMTAFLLMAAKDGRIKKEADSRRKQIEADHPKVLDQYALYYTAGMNPRAIWYAMCKRYEENRDGSKKGKRYVYEEMIEAKNRMEEGMGELAAYDEFARRCDSISFRSFISFVKQTVEKGNDGLGDILRDEMDKARREKNNRIKTEASEAETKMLLPMFMMLTVVLAVVMIPAFIGLNG